MDPLFGFPALAALAVGFVAVRRVVKRRRQSLQEYTRTRDQRLRQSKPKDRRSSRAVMRSLDDPTTVMGEMRSRPPRPDGGDGPSRH